MRQRFAIELASLWNKVLPDAVLVGCSGGLDSMTLVHLLREYAQHKAPDMRIGLAYANYGLRLSSADEAAFVRAYARKTKCAFHTRDFKDALMIGAKVANPNNKKASIQKKARDLRYQWFEILRQSHHYDYVLTAHHLDDDIEGFLLNVLRGTGWRGLCGMPQQRAHLVRPLLNFTRKQIENYARKAQLTWCEDESNKEPIYRRNQIRMWVVPHLRQCHPHIDRPFDRMRRRMKQTAALLQHVVAEFAAKHLVKTPQYDCLRCPSALEAHHAALIWETLHTHYQIGFEEFERLWRALCEKRSGRMFETKTHQMTIDRNLIYSQTHARAKMKLPDYSLKSPHEKPVLNHTKWTLTIRPNQNLPYKQAKKDEAYLAYDALAFPLTIRAVRPGDVFYPLGLKGKKKLSDFMIDAKIPLPLKKEITVLTSHEGAIVWVVAHQIDERFKVKADTKRVLHIRLCPVVAVN